MSAFRIEPVYQLPTIRVLHGDRKLAVALITAEPDGQVALFPVEFENPPPPLTGETKVFPRLRDALVFLGLQEETAA